MQILSNGERMLAICQNYTVEWYIGSHTANIYNEFCENTDGFTFAWHKDKASMLDFTTALASYLSEE